MTSQSYPDPAIPRLDDRRIRDPHDSDQRTLDNVVPERLEPLDERARLRSRTRDDHLHAARAAEMATSSVATASVSSPERRSSHDPSSAATIAVRTTPSWWAATGAR